MEQVIPRDGRRTASDALDDVDFDERPVKPRGAAKAVLVTEGLPNQRNIELALKGEKFVEDFDLGQVKPRGFIRPLNLRTDLSKETVHLHGENEELISPEIREKLKSPVYPITAIDFDENENLSQFDAILDNCKKNAAFIDDLSFLEQFGGNDEEAAKRAEELARKSLYIRFDPLVKPDSSGKPREAASQSTSRGSTGDLPMRGSSNPSASSNLAARLQAVKEASKSSEVVSPKSNQCEYADANDPFSPAKTPQLNSSRLSSVSARPLSVTHHDKGLVEPLVYTQSDLDEVVRVREEEWKRKYEDLNSRIKEEVAMRELLEQDNRDKVEAIRKENLEMKHVVEEYEKTIVVLTENSHHSNLHTEQTLAETVRAKEQLQQELHGTEANLVDAYKRVEKLKQVIDTYKQNEDLLKQSLNDFQDKLKRSEERYQALKKQAAEKVDAANVEISKVRKQKEVDLAGLEAALRMANSRISSLEQDVVQKVRANQELTSICDELIKKVSGEK